MMRSFLIIILLGAIGTLSAQTIVPGYYITNTNDRIETTIKIPRSVFVAEDLGKLLFKVDVIDSANESTKMKPGDIKAFGFVLKSKNYSYFSKPSGTDKNLKFLQPLVQGKNTSLYFFETLDQNGRHQGTFYTIEKEENTYTYLSTGLLRLQKVKEQLTELYKSYSGIDSLINTKFQNRADLQQDLIDIAKEVNLR